MAGAIAIEDQHTDDTGVQYCPERKIELLPQSKDTFWAMQNDQAVGMTLLFILEGRGSAKELSVTTPQGQQVTATRG